MPNTKLEDITVFYGGFPQAIPAELTPQAAYMENGIGTNVRERIKFWKEKYPNLVDPTIRFGSSEVELASLEDFYLRDLVT